MHINEVSQKYNMPLEERIVFVEFIKNSNYKYSFSFWKGLSIDDGEDIDGIVTEFRNTYSRLLDEQKQSKHITTSAEPAPTAEHSKLISCPDCGKQVSRRASVCIHCGCPISADEINAAPKFYGVKRISDKWVMGKAATFISRAWVINGQATGIKDLDIIASGITKERAELLLNYLISNRGEGEIFEDTNCTQENKEMTRYIDVNINPNAPVMCPRCGSTQVVIGQRGYSVVSGFLGSQKTTNRCGKCGYTWQPK